MRLIGRRRTRACYAWSAGRGSGTPVSMYSVVLVACHRQSPFQAQSPLRFSVKPLARCSPHHLHENQPRKSSLDAIGVKITRRLDAAKWRWTLRGKENVGSEVADLGSPRSTRGAIDRHGHALTDDIRDTPGGARVRAGTTGSVPSIALSDLDDDSLRAAVGEGGEVDVDGRDVLRCRRCGGTVEGPQHSSCICTVRRPGGRLLCA